MNSLDRLLQQIRTTPDTVEFNNVLAVIGENYTYTPTRFANGIGPDPVVSEPGQNEGSCRVFAFARLHNLSKAETLACFGHFYRDEVLKDPAGSSHANIRRFMQDGWEGIRFEGEVLVRI